MLRFNSLLSGGELKTQGILPKTNLSDVIIRDNMSEQRLFKLKEKHIESMKRKTATFYDHLKKRFLSDLQKKNARWEKEHESFIKFLEKEKKVKHVTSDRTKTSQKRLPRIPKTSHPTEPQSSNVAKTNS